MRLSEQYSCTWLQVNLRLGSIDLTKTKNGFPRLVHLNADALAAIKSTKKLGQHSTEPVFPRAGIKKSFDNRSWFLPLPRECQNQWLCMAFEPSYFLFVARNGRGVS
jgi:integrase